MEVNLKEHVQCYTCETPISFTFEASTPWLRDTTSRNSHGYAAGDHLSDCRPS
jgi:hypothetical protein